MNFPPTRTWIEARLSPRVRHGFLASCLSAIFLVAGAGCKSSVSPVHGGGLAAQGPEPLEAVEIEPAPGFAEVGPLSTIRLRFSEALDSGSLGASPLIVTELRSLDRVPGASSLEAGGKELRFTPSVALRPDLMLSVRVAESLRSASGASLAEEPGPQSVELPVFYSTFAELPTLRGSLELVEATSFALQIAWQPASDNNSPDGSSIRYDIFLARAPAPIDYDGTPEKRTTAGATTDAITRLEPGVTYRVALRAVDPAGNSSAPSNELLAATTSEDDREAPEFDGIVKLESDPQLPHELKASWNAGVDRPNPATPLSYNVYVAFESGKQEFNLPARTSPPGATELVLDGLQSDTEYFVVVRAVDAAGNEETNVVEAPTPRRTAVSFEESIFKILTLPNGYDASLCWPACTNPVQPGGCARSRCHTANNPAGGYNMTTYVGIMASSNRGPRVVAGMPERSLLLQRIRSTSGNRMPQGGTCNLFGGCIDAIERWILEGALEN